MKFRYPAFLTVLLIAVTGLFGTPESSGQAQGRALQEGVSIKSPVRSVPAFENAGQGRKAQAEKRHGKSLISEAFLTDLSIPDPRFSYGSRKYSLFLPGGDSRQPVNSYSLRGPPFNC